MRMRIRRGYHVLVKNGLTIIILLIIFCIHDGQAGVSSNKEVQKCVKNFDDQKCISRNNTTIDCYGSTLSYKEFSAHLNDPNFSATDTFAEMERWNTLKQIPKCWKVLHPLLCSFYLPKCVTNDNGTVTINLPPQDLCRKARQPCSVFEEQMTELPKFLRCEEDVFMQHCENDEVSKLMTNTTSECQAPMIKVPEGSLNIYKGFEPCGLECKNPLFTDDDHDFVTKTIRYMGIVTSTLTGLVILTYLIDWRSARGYPSVIVLYVNIGFFVATMGWMFQFFPNGKTDIVCRKDLTIRKSEPVSGENVFCILVFIVIYWGTNAALAWLCVFAYVWNLTCNSVGRIQARVDKQAAYYHGACWLIPVLMIVLCLSLSAVDADSLSGICYIGYFNAYHRIYLVILPTCVCFLVMMYFMIRGVCKLASLTVLSNSDFISRSGRAFVTSKAARVALFCVVSGILMIIFVILQIDELQKRSLWSDSLRKYHLCNLKLNNEGDCGEPEKPNLNYITWNISLFFIGGILVSTWAWTGPTYRAWRRCISKRFKSEHSLEQHNPAKHKLISQAFAKRRQIEKMGRLSLNLGSTHEDPIGFNKLLDPNHLCQNLNDAEMQTHHNTNTEPNEEISSEWAAALPHLVARRNGIVPPHSSNSVSCVSEDSRRPSCDSAVSEIAMRQGSHEYKKYRKRDWFRRSRNGKLWSSPWRRGTAGSSSSIESNTGSQILPAITALIDKRMLRANEDDLFTPLNNAAGKAVGVRELAIQTSFDPLPFLPPKSNGKNCNLSNNLTSDKSIQTSLVSLHEKTTQTKKSISKKRDKDGNERSGRSHRNKDKSQPKAERDRDRDKEEDPVLKLLTPN